MMQPATNTTPTKTPIGFTLVELLIAVTISAILFIGVLVFVSSNMGQSIKQEKTLTQISAWGEFEKTLTDNLQSSQEIVYSGSSFGSYASGVVLSQENGAPYVFIGLKYATGACDTFSGAENASGTGYKLVVKNLVLENYPHIITGPFKLHPADNAVYNGTTLVIGTEFAGSRVGATGLETELDHPSAIAQKGNILYIADTLNNRIVTYNTSTNKASIPLGAIERMLLPTDLFLVGSDLYIANSGRGEILQYSDGEGNSTAAKTILSPQADFQANTTLITYDGGNKFTGGSIAISGTSNSGSTQTTSSGLMQEFDSLQNFSSGSNHTIILSGLNTAIPPSPGTHTLSLEFYSGSNLQYSTIAPYYTQGDGLLETNTGNVLKIIASGKNFPHNITGPTGYSEGISDWSGAINNANASEDISSGFVDNFRWNQNGRILTLHWEQYNYYDCLAEKHKRTEKILKVLLK